MRSTTTTVLKVPTPGHMKGNLSRTAAAKSVTASICLSWFLAQGWEVPLLMLGTLPCRVTEETLASRRRAADGMHVFCYVFKSFVMVVRCIFRIAPSVGLAWNTGLGRPIVENATGCLLDVGWRHPPVNASIVWFSMLHCTCPWCR